MQGSIFVGHKRLTGKLDGIAHLAADAGAAGKVAADAEGALVGLLGSNLYGTLCGARNNGPF